MSQRDYVLAIDSDRDELCHCCLKSPVTVRVLFPTNDTIFRCHACFLQVRAGNLLEWRGTYVKN